MTTRDKAMQILGQLTAISYPISIGKTMDESQAYYDLIDSIIAQYEALLKEFYPDFDNK